MGKFVIFSEGRPIAPFGKLWYNTFDEATQNAWLSHKPSCKVIEDKQLTENDMVKIMDFQSKVIENLTKLIRRK